MREKTIDVLKGIGIISVVIGHATWTISLGKYSFDIGRFVYLYHIALFIFAAGYVFKKDAVKEFSGFLWKKVKSLYIPFLKYATLLLLLRPVCIKMGILSESKNISDYLSMFINILLFQTFGEFASALWFVPMFFITNIIFAVLIRSSGKFRYANQVLLMGVIFFGIMGIELVSRNMSYLYRIEIAFMYIPIMGLGYCIKKYWEKIQKVFLLLPGVIAGIIIYSISNRTGSYIDVSCNMIMGKILFYVVTVLGIYFSVSVSRFICKFKIISDVLAKIGQYTFLIMAFHLITSKMIDWIYINVTQSNYDMLLAFPRGLQQLTLLYWIGNTLFPIGGYLLIKRMKGKVLNAK